MADETAEPVVGVQHIGRRVVLDVVDHGIAEVVDHGRELFLAQVIRTGGDVTRDGRLDLDDFGKTWSRCPRVRRALDTGLGERRHELAHVHIHAATVARARLGGGDVWSESTATRCTEMRNATESINIPGTPGAHSRFAGDEAFVDVEQGLALLGAELLVGGNCLTYAHRGLSLGGRNPARS